MEEALKQKRLLEIEQQIQRHESNKKVALIMMGISIFFLWPLLIVGLIIYCDANHKIDKLNTEKREIMFNEWGNNDQATFPTSEKGKEE